MIIFQTFQGLENFPIFFPNFSRICTNPVYLRQGPIGCNREPR